jgi:hypothetical protein
MILFLPVYQPTECPGLYCGKRELGPGEYSGCGVLDNFL